jgi:hypothetical protein
MSDVLTVTEQGLPVREPSPAAMLDRAIEMGMDPGGIEKLVNLYTRMDDRRRVKALRAVLNKAEKGGGVRFTFADYEAISDEVEPLLAKYKFAHSYDAEFLEGGRMQVSLKLTHGGHSQVTRFPCRIGDGPPGASAMQADAAAVTYAKRFVLCLALDIVVEKIFEGADARVVGDSISPAMAADLEKRAEKFPKKIPFLLALAEAETFAQIPQGAYRRVNKALSKWESGPKEQSAPAALPASLSPGKAPCDHEGNLL